MEGEDDIDVRWAVPDLAAAVAAVRPLAGDLAKLADPDGSAKGSLRIRRNRKKSGTFSVTGSVDADLRKVHFSDRPKLDVRGKAKVRLDGKTLALTVPRFVLRRRGSPKEPDAAVLENFRVSFSQKDLWKGRFVARKATAKSLKLNISMDPDKNTNIGAILKPKTTKSSKAIKRKSSSNRSPSRSRRAKNRQLLGIPRLVSQFAQSFTKKKPRKLPAERPAKNLPVVKIDLIEITSLDLLFVHQFEKGNRPIRLEWKNLNLRVDKLNTRMRPGRMDTLVQLVAPGSPSPLSIVTNVNPGVSPPAMRGTVTLNRFDLRLVSPYAEQVRGMKIQRGTVDLSSKFSLRRDYLKARSNATVFDLDLKTTRRTPLVDDAQILLQRVAIRLLKRDNKQIPVKVKIEGQLDDPSFYIVRALTESLLASVFDTIVSAPGAPRDSAGTSRAF